MPMWLAPEKKTRSPGCSWLSETGAPMPYMAYELCGSETPIWAKTYITKPEQSNPRGVEPPQTYGTPRYCIAIPTTPPCTFGGAIVEPSGVDAPTPMPLTDCDVRPARRDCAAAASWRCCATSAALMRAISPRIDERSCRREASCDSMC